MPGAAPLGDVDIGRNRTPTVQLTCHEYTLLYVDSKSPRQDRLQLVARIRYQSLVYGTPMLLQVRVHARKGAVHLSLPNSKRGRTSFPKKRCVPFFSLHSHPVVQSYQLSQHLPT
jgi:hypothetical protein